jgi:hypothetical protein
MITKKVPRRMWCYGLRYIAKLSQFIPQRADGRTGYEVVTGRTPDISEYCDFAFWDLVWYHTRTAANMSKTSRALGRWSGISHRVGSDMCYWVMPVSGQMISETTVQHVTRYDLENAEIAAAVEEFNGALTTRLDDTNFWISNDHGVYIDDFDVQPDAAYGDEADTPTTDEYGGVEYEEVNDADIDSYDKFLGAKIRLSNDSNNGANMATVVARATDYAGRPIGKAHSNPLLDGRLYEVELDDGTTDRYFANQIAENIWAQVDTEGRQVLVMQEICDHRKNERAIPIADGYTIKRNGEKVPKVTTDGWELLVEFKDGTTEWVKLKDVKDSNPIELAEYAIANQLQEEPAFKWWAEKALRRRDRAVFKVKSKYYRTTHKYGVRIPKTIEEALRIDEENGNHLWGDAIRKEMSKVRVAYKPHESHTPEEVRCGGAPDLTGFQEIRCHIIFDVKMDFTRKARFVAGGHTTEAPAAMTYSSVVSRESVRLAYLIAALHDLELTSADISNAYLHAPCKEKIWFQAGAECGEHRGKVMIVTRALYGLKSAGASWRSMLSTYIVNEMGFVSTRVDPDVYRRKSVKPNGEPYYELLLVYVDDILLVSAKPGEVFKQIASQFTIKDDRWGPPTQFLGSEVEEFIFEDGGRAWSTTCHKYVKNAVDTVKQLLREDGRQFKSSKRCEGPLPVDYRPELDTTDELPPDLVSRFQQLIGIGRWAVELGRIDIHLEIALMSQYQASPRYGHLEAMYTIFHYLARNRKWRNVYDPRLPNYRESAFNTEADWSEFYPDAKEEDPPSMPEPLGEGVEITCFVDADHAGNKVTRRSHSGILIFVQNALITSWSKRQNTVESSTFGSELVCMRQARDLLVALRIKLKMFGVRILKPANVWTDNNGVMKNTSIPTSMLGKKHNSINYHVVREAVAAGVMRVAKEDTRTNPADALTKILRFDRKQKLLWPLGHLLVSRAHQKTDGPGGAAE